MWREIVEEGEGNRPRGALRLMLSLSARLAVRTDEKEVINMCIYAHVCVWSRR